MTQAVFDAAKIESLTEQAKETLNALQTSIVEPELLEEAIDRIFDVDIEMAFAITALHEGITLQEALVKHVRADGTVERLKDRITRKNQAYQTTGLSSAERRRIARRAAKTLRQRPTVMRKKNRRRLKALKKRKSMGIKPGQ